MKYLIILFALFFSSPLLADSSFLAGLNFARVYEENGDNQYTLISEKGISVENFIKKINNSNTTLGEKVALINALSSYYEWAEKPKGNFGLYQKKFSSTFKDVYKQDISPQNENLKPEIRLLSQLMEDYETSSPHVEIYQMLAKKMPNSLTAQSVSVIALAYDILYNDKNDFAGIQNLKNNHLKPYYENFESFEADVPVEIRKIGVDEFLPYTFDCQNRLKCLVDTSTEQSVQVGLNDLAKTIKKNIGSGTKLSDSYMDWTGSKSEALEWLNLQEKYIEKSKATDLQKAQMKYFFNIKLYNLMHNYDNLSVLFWDSSLMTEMNQSKAKCKTDAKCAANEYVKKIQPSLEKKGISKKDIELLTSAKNKFETKFESNTSDFAMDAVAGVGSAEEELRYSFNSNFDTLHFLMIYFYNNPEKISEMYDLK